MDYENYIYLKIYSLNIGTFIHENIPAGPWEEKQKSWKFFGWFLSEKFNRSSEEETSTNVKKWLTDGKLGDLSLDTDHSRLMPEQIQKLLNKHFKTNKNKLLRCMHRTS